MKVTLKYPVDVFEMQDQVHVMPIKILVLADASYDDSRPAGRPFHIDKDNFEYVLKQLKTTVQLDWENHASDVHCILPQNLEIGFKRIKDFTPESLINRVPILNTLLKVRIAIDQAVADAEVDPNLPVDAIINNEGNDVQAALVQYNIDMADAGKSKSENQKAFLNSVCNALDPAGKSVNAAPRSQLELIREEIDSALSRGLDSILHHPAVRKLQATWLSLQRLAECASSDVQIELLDISKAQLSASFKEPLKGSAEAFCDLDQLLLEEYQLFGGTAYTLIIGDYEFDSSQRDVELLDHLGRLCYRHAALFFSSISVRLVAWGDDEARFYLRVKSLSFLFEGPQYLRWMELRRKKHAQCIFLCMPRFLIKNPFREEVETIGLYEYEEAVTDTAENWQIWGNPSYLMAEKLVREHATKGWCGNIRGTKGAKVGAAKIHQRHDGHRQVKTCGPLEVKLPVTKQWEFATQGLISLDYDSHLNTFIFMFPIALAKARYYPSTEEGDSAETYDHCFRRLDYRLCVNRCSQWIQAYIKENFFMKPNTMDGIEAAVTQLMLDHCSPSGKKDGRPFEKSALKVEMDENDASKINIRYALWPKSELRDVPLPLRGEITLSMDTAQAGETSTGFRLESIIINPGYVMDHEYDEL